MRCRIWMETARDDHGQAESVLVTSLEKTTQDGVRGCDRVVVTQHSCPHGYGGLKEPGICGELALSRFATFHAASQCPHVMTTLRMAASPHNLRNNQKLR